MIRHLSFAVLFLLFSMRAVTVVAADQPAEPEASSEVEIQVEKDIAYLGDDRAEKADLYLPLPHADGGRPGAIVVIHGGGWVGGDKAAARERNIGPTLARHGYAAVRINYRLAPKGERMAAWPGNLHDCKSAVRWLRENADQYGFDATRVGVIGGSAGGHLAAMLGAAGPDAGLEPEGWPAEISSRVDAVVDLYGPTHVGLGPLGPDSDPATSPITYLDAGDPPFLVIHGTADTTVSVDRSKEFAEALASAGVKHELVIVEGAPHSFHLEPKQQDLRPIVLEFFDTHLRADMTAGDPQ